MGKRLIYAEEQLISNMPSIIISNLSGQELRNNQRLQKEIRNVVAPSYEDASSILSREFIDCNSVYIGRDSSGSLVCFYLTTWELINSEKNKFHAVHLGLSATRQDTKGIGYIAALYAKCVQDAIEWEKIHQKQLILWSTTASPIVYLAVNRFLRDTEPRIDGSFTPEGKAIANELRLHLRVPYAHPDSHPFVLKGIAKGTKYSLEESHRLEKIKNKKKFSLFDKLGVKENHEDRILFIARTPHDINYRT